MQAIQLEGVLHKLRCSPQVLRFVSDVRPARAQGFPEASSCERLTQGMHSGIVTLCVSRSKSVRHFFRSYHHPYQLLSSVGPGVPDLSSACRSRMVLLRNTPQIGIRLIKAARLHLVVCLSSSDEKEGRCPWLQCPPLQLRRRRLPGLAPGREERL